MITRLWLWLGEVEGVGVTEGSGVGGRVTGEIGEVAVRRPGETAGRRAVVVRGVGRGRGGR
jgi:hypothetical protein